MFAAWTNLEESLLDAAPARERNCVMSLKRAPSAGQPEKTWRGEGHRAWGGVARC